MRTVLSVGAHPDDIEIGCGGTEALLKGKGYRLIHIVATSGGEGRIDIAGPKLKRLREREAEASARVLGAETVVFLRFPDGLTNFTKGMKTGFISLIRRFKPEVVFTHSSEDRFPDHALVHALTISALTAAAGPWYARAGGEPHSVPKVLGYEVWHPIGRHHLAVDISVGMGRKLAALRCHRSQTATVDYLSAVRGLGLYRGATTGKGEYAEVFEAIKTEGLL